MVKIGAKWRQKCFGFKELLADTASEATSCCPECLAAISNT